MTQYQTISLLLGSGFLVSIMKYFLDRLKKADQKTEAVCLGVQALLRDQLLQNYNYYKEKGYAPIYAKENFENMWQQYHSLGANGVMDEVHERFKKLPLEKEDV